MPLQEFFLLFFYLKVGNNKIKTLNYLLLKFTCTHTHTKKTHKYRAKNWIKFLFFIKKNSSFLFFVSIIGIAAAIL